MIINVIAVYNNKFGNYNNTSNIIDNSRMARINQLRSIFFVSLQQFICVDDSKNNNTNNDIVLCSIGDDSNSRRMYAVSLYDLPTVVVHYLGLNIDIHTYNSKNNRDMPLGRSIVNIKYHYEYPEHVEMHFDHCLKEANSAFRKMAEVIENICKIYLKCSVNNYKISDTIDDIVNQKGMLEPCLSKCVKLCDACLIEMEPELANNKVNWLR